MRSPRSRTIAAALAATLLAPLFAVLAPSTAGALPVGKDNSCKNSQNAGAEMGMFPAMPGSQSALKVSCLWESDFDAPYAPADPLFLEHDQPYMVSSAFTVHDFENALYHNGAARTVTATGTSGTSTLNITTVLTAPSSTNNGMAGWVNRAITGTGIAPRTFITGVAGSVISLSENLTAAASGRYKIDNAVGARSFDTGTITLPSTVTTAAGVGNSANFQASDADPDGAGPLLGLSISGTRFPNNCTIATVVNANTATTACVINSAGGPNEVITIGGTMQVSTTRVVYDGLRDNGVNQRVTTTSIKVDPTDIGMPVYGPAGAFAPTAIVDSIVNQAFGRIKIGGACGAACVLTAGTGEFRIGDPTGTAAANGDNVLSLGVELDLSAALVAGSQSCSREEPEGFAQAGTIFQPGSFQSPLFDVKPTGAPILYQILFDGATTNDFAAYVVQKNAASPGDIALSAHTDIVFGSLPLSLALCDPAPTTGYDSPGLALSLTMNATTASQAALPSGVGRPSTSQNRAVQGPSGTYTSTVYIDSQAGPPFAPGANFNRICIYPAAPEVSFTCGNG